MKVLTAAIATVALSVALAGCDDKKTETKTSTSTSTSTSTTTSTTPGAQAHKTIDDYVTENHITETPVHMGDPGSPVINLPMPPGWNKLDGAGPSYGAIVLAQPADPNDPPSIAALVSKLTGNVDPAKILELAPGELQNLSGYDGGNGTASTLSGFQAWQVRGSYTKLGKKRTAAQETVVIPVPAQNAVYMVQFNADSLDAESGPLIDATKVIDEQTTITLP
ncbi:MAG: LpqN/LpqT family lipoprotein [Mycobacterium sp.]